MFKNWDIGAGVGGMFATIHFQDGLAVLAGVLTCGILALRLRKEWRSRNDKGKEDGDGPASVLALLLIASLAFSGCAPSALKGGRARTAPAKNQPGAVAQEISQGENPAAPSSQNQETIEVRSYTLPAGSVIASGVASNRAEVIVAAPVPVVERREVRARTELGAAQKDTAREMAARLKALSGVVWVGVVVFLFGVASFFYPPLRAIVGSVTTSAAISAGGLALIILPTVIVGHEVLILGGVAVGVGGWFLAHRHGSASAKSKVLEAQVADLLKK